MSEGEYGAILIDPPWPQDNYVDKDVVPARGAQPYPPMTLAEIAGLPMQKLMAPKCAVFLWTIDNIPDAPFHLAWSWGRPGKPLRVVRANQFVWHKVTRSLPVRTHYGLGRWTRGGTEVVWLLLQGQPRRKKPVGALQVVQEPRREHSRKPDLYDRIEGLVEGPYCEMFARQQWPGWTSFGDEVNKFRART